ncbi:MAG: hypothetical protein ABIM59_07640 [candidate division WOR-3 bacterium]
MMIYAFITTNILVGQWLFAKTFGGTNQDIASSIIQTTDGGYAVAGWTWSFGAGDWDLLVLKLDQDGNYPGCVQECFPTVMDVSPVSSSPSVGASCFPTTSEPSLTVGTPAFAVTDACPPVNVEEKDAYGKPGITCSLLPGAALFLSPEDVGIKIYKADGRLVYSAELKRGENQLSLEPGVYLWETSHEEPGKRSQSGKIVVR